ncbi:lanc-like protein 2 [Stylonychia lemnae]|uniref:Lanc-like protein 2 n=1 Tax=Stylonychia lemnae TaxID=5949 RepID=A0A078ASH0_STYLE|nr:lanc-like protein 2 [Stylonychia lemnae]|eukprot:CDW85390.1 lanc-like protein 2 [Stylonychia lemnae]
MLKSSVTLFIAAFISVSSVQSLQYAKNGGCTGYDQPPGDKMYYDHFNVIKPYQDKEQVYFDQKYRDLMSLRVDQYVNMTLINAPPDFKCDLGDDTPCNWVFTGSSSRALTFWKLYQNTKKTNPAKSKYYLDLARQYIEGSLKDISDKYDDFISFINGNPGVYAIASVIYDSLGDSTKAQQFIDKVDVVFSKPMTNKIDYDDGIPGYFYTLDFLETYYDRPLFSRDNVMRYASHLFDYGYNHKLENGTLIFPEPFPDTRTSLGFGRGAAGMLFRLMQVPEVLQNETMVKHIKLTIDYMIARQRPDGQVADIQPGMEERVQWCHGAPSATPVFALAYKIFGDQKYLLAADLAANYTFNYGVLLKGMGLCHGTSSNIYMILYLYSITKDPKYKYFAIEMHKFALDTPTLTDPEKMMSWDCVGQYSSFIDTAASAIATYSDMLTYIDGQEENMWMIGWGKISHKTENQHAHTFLE